MDGDGIPDLSVEVCCWWNSMTSEQQTDLGKGFDTHSTTLRKTFQMLPRKSVL